MIIPFLGKFFWIKDFFANFTNDVRCISQKLD